MRTTPPATTPTKTGRRIIEPRPIRRMSVGNEKIARLFENMGVLLEMKRDTVFKVRAYQRAARTINHLSFSLVQAVEDGTDLKQIPGIDRAINDKIHELLLTDWVPAYEKLVAELPDGVLTLMDVPNIGPRTAMLITQELGISTIEGVEQAVRDGRMAALPRTGQKTAEKILRHVLAMQTQDQRTPIGQALPLAEEVIAGLWQACLHNRPVFPGGGLRR